MEKGNQCKRFYTRELYPYHGDDSFLVDSTKRLKKFGAN